MCGGLLTIDLAVYEVEIEELHNSHGGIIRTPRTGVGASYLCCSNCDGSYSNCDGIKPDALTIAKVDQ